MSTIKNKKKSFKELINSDSTAVLVDFYASWCGPCQTLSPIVQQVAKELGDQVKVIKVDIDKNPAAAQQFQVRSVPTLMIFKTGKVLWRKSGLMTKRELLSSVQRVVNH
ncbi:thioredoxin 1 [Catalinimonas alkaloidigena]|uniref:thioredoxin n=1 Tax=Catalinimonas alkaloidigena TaxID=1075417 RepID=UPI00240538BE|nr:thioredoxin [Catalinimonas alkaloidigena]MDF9800964.1 thioredoxin 1 [Catalinimonas alkaloidigena]